MAHIEKTLKRYGVESFSVRTSPTTYKVMYTIPTQKNRLFTNPFTALREVLTDRAREDGHTEILIKDLVDEILETTKHDTLKNIKKFWVPDL